MQGVLDLRRHFEDVPGLKRNQAVFDLKRFNSNQDNVILPRPLVIMKAVAGAKAGICRFRGREVQIGQYQMIGLKQG